MTKELWINLAKQKQEEIEEVLTQTKYESFFNDNLRFEVYLTSDGEVGQYYADCASDFSPRYDDTFIKLADFTLGQQSWFNDLIDYGDFYTSFKEELELRGDNEALALLEAAEPCSEEGYKEIDQDLFGKILDDKVYDLVRDMAPTFDTVLADLKNRNDL